MQRILLLLLFVCGACSAPGPEARPPEEQFGSREVSDGSEVLDVTPPDSSRSYFTLSVPVAEIIVRPEPWRTTEVGEGTRVEVLVKGALPDACAELHAVEQERAANLIRLTVTMRRPHGALCATVVRPYRFYVMLEGRFAPGPYSLLVNGEERPFEVAPPAVAQRRG